MPDFFTSMYVYNYAGLPTDHPDMHVYMGMCKYVCTTNQGYLLITPGMRMCMCVCGMTVYDCYFI